MMLLYNKALDANHTLLRMTALLVSWKAETVEGEALRLFDFLIANPAHIQKLSVPRDRFVEKNEFKSYKNRYQNFDPKSLFNAMKETHYVVIERLVDLGIFQAHKNSSEYQVLLDNIPEELKNLAESRENSISSQAIDFIVANLITIPVTGSDGLKKITSLMDYKYDVN
ncbi:ABC-three component system middle component 5 [Paraferrimonas sp. SM1919]|uniref:ABC-three component system middle component 5 n=1 Tax=Paraferrimonas sp. SM1919 TaxID=2662263 RepID=UPI0013D5542F|nr:ABC-three component system middle component 5 [Paraferrimonas sp. SM1919]